MRQLKKITVTTANLFYDEVYKYLISEDACYTVTSDSDQEFGKTKQTFVVDWQMQALEWRDLKEKS